MTQPSPVFPYRYDDAIADAMARCPCDTVACTAGCTVGGRYDPVTDTLTGVPMGRTLKYVKDPDGIVHVMKHQTTAELIDDDYETVCGMPIFFSQKWRTCFPYDRRPTCIGCLVT